MTKTRPHGKKRYFPKLSWLLLLLTISGCGGLVKLNIPTALVTRSPDNWMTPYRNNQRWNSMEQDVLPPYREVWSHGYRSVVTDHPLAIREYLLLTTRSGMLAVFDIKLGDLLGDGHLVPGFLHAPALKGDTLFYAANLGQHPLGAFDLSNLESIWKRKLPHLNTSPMLLADKVYAGGDSGKFFCLKQKDGQRVWEFTAVSDIYGTPAASGNRIFVADIQGRVYCLNAGDGTVLWQTQIQSNVYSGPLFAENRVFIGSTSGYFYALDAATGKEVWRYNSGASIYGNAAYAGGVVYFGNDGHRMTALKSANGEVLWQFKTRGVNNTAPLAGKQYLYFGSWDRSFYVLDRFTGDLIYRREFKKAIKSSPIIYRGRLYLHIANRRLYCLETAREEEEEK